MSDKSKQRPRAASLKRVVRAKLWHAKQRLNQRWLDECETLLNETGVPQYVCLVGESVPDNSVPGRLKWYLLRRKNVQRWETDNLDNEMKLAEQVVRDWMPFGSNACVSDGPADGNDNKSSAEGPFAARNG